MKEFVLTVDLKRSRRAVEAYERHHRAVWPEVLRSLGRIGVRRLEIFRLGRRLVMVLGTTDSFDLERSFARHEASDPVCREWEALMRTFQSPPAGAPKGRLWTAMSPIFSLAEQRRALGRSKPPPARRRPSIRRAG